MIKFLLFILSVSVISLFLPSIALADNCLDKDPCWVTKAPMPTARRALGVAIDSNGLIYAVGGYDGVGEFLNTLEMYNPANDTWTIKPPMPIRRNAMGFVFHSATNKFYAIGGFNGSGAFPDPLINENDEYDPVVDT